MNVCQIRSFHGLAGFYRRFVNDFSIVAAPLNELTKKGVEFVWGVAQDLAFAELKKRLTEAPLLVLPDFTKNFEIECDASVKRFLSSAKALSCATPNTNSTPFLVSSFYGAATVLKSFINRR